MIGKIFILGDRPGAGQTMKLVNNVLPATAMAATSEAMVTGVKAGLDPRLMLDVINAGTGRNTATENKFTKSILPGTFDLGFTAGLMLKDVKLFLAEREAARRADDGHRGGCPALPADLRRTRTGCRYHRGRAADREARRREGAGALITAAAAQ